jgi:hypothetical protein
MKAIVVVRCGITNCTGEKQIKMPRESSSDVFAGAGAGDRLFLNQIK